MVVISRVVVTIPSAISLQQNPFPLVWSLHPDCHYIQSRYNQNLLYVAISAKRLATKAPHDLQSDNTLPEYNWKWHDVQVHFVKTVHLKRV